MSINKQTKREIYSIILLIVVVSAIVYAVNVIRMPETDNSANKTSFKGMSALLTLIEPVGRTVEVGVPQKIVWTSSNYEPDTVNINLIRKVSDNPATYELVRTVAGNKTNTGNATWIPNQNDVGSAAAIEVGCSLSENACTSISGISRPLAIVHTDRNTNTASAYEAIESLMNR